MAFGEMLTCHDRAARAFQLLGSADPRESARRELDRVTRFDARSTNNASPIVHLSVERAWDDDHRPSYQVAGALCEALQLTKLDLDPTYVQFPHRAFALELPLEGQGMIRDPQTGRRLLALLMGGVKRRLLPGGRGASFSCEVPDNHVEWRSLMVQRWEGEDEIDPPWFLTTYQRGKSVADSVEEALAVPFRETISSRSDGGVRPSQETLGRAIRLAIGAALFAVGANSRFRERVPEPRQRRRRREREAKKGRPAPVGEEEVKRWRLGATIALPRFSEGGGASDGESKGLRFAHLRQGHLRMQRTGSRGDHKYVLRYIKPTVVRPDLGFPEGYQATKHRLDTPRNPSG